MRRLPRRPLEQRRRWWHVDTGNALNVVSLGIAVLVIFAETKASRLVGLIVAGGLYAVHNYWRGEPTSRRRGLLVTGALVAGTVALVAASLVLYRDGSFTATDTDPHLTISADVRPATARPRSRWDPTVDVHPGEQVDFLLTVDNDGGRNLYGLKVRVVPGPGLRLVPGSVHWIDAVQDDVRQDDVPLFSGGIILGNYAPGGGFYIRYRMELPPDAKVCDERVAHLAYVSSDELDERMGWVETRLVGNACGS